VDEKTYNYSLLPARLGFGVHDASNSIQHIWQIRHKVILLLDSNFVAATNDQAFPVDYLIITQQCTYQPRLWQQLFRPRQIILDSSLPRWKAQQWVKELKSAGANVYSVGVHGAFILGN
jgi:hypothetical protein